MSRLVCVCCNASFLTPLELGEVWFFPFVFLPYSSLNPVHITLPCFALQRHHTVVVNHWARPKAGNDRLERTASAFGLHLSFSTLHAVSKVMAACVYALLLQLANEPSPPRASLIPFSCFIKTKLRVMLSWQINCYLGKKTIRMQLNLFCNALNCCALLFLTMMDQKKKLPSW